MSSFSRSRSRFFRSDHDPEASSSVLSSTRLSSFIIFAASNLPPKWSFHFKRFPAFLVVAVLFDASPFAKLDDLSELFRTEAVSTFFNKLENDDFLVSSTFTFFAVGEYCLGELSELRFDEVLSLVGTFLWSLSFRSFTDLCQASFITLIRSTIATLFGEFAQIRCFSNEPTNFPKPLSFTIDFVTGSNEILVSK